MKKLFFLFCMVMFSDSYSQQEPSQYLNEGITAVRGGAYTDAIELLTQYLNSDPQNAVGRYNRAVAYYFTNDFPDALTDATTAIMNSPNYKEAYNIRGQINTSSKMMQDAISDFTSAINIDPQYAEAYMNRGVVYKIQNDYPMAISDLNNAIMLNPSLVPAYFYRGDVLVSMGNYNAAIKDLNTYIMNFTDKSAAYSARGLAYYQTGNYSQAVSDLEKAISLNPIIEKDFATVLNDAKVKANQK